MKTWQAILLHLGTTAAQAFVAAPILTGTGTGSIFGNYGIQTGAQLALSGLQIWAANKNSHTDPNGNKLAESIDGSFHSTK